MTARSETLGRHILIGHSIILLRIERFAVNVGIVSSFIIPSEAVWRRAAYEMLSAIMKPLGIAAGPFGALSVPNPLMVLYAAL
ncbi:hypothetical protein L0152_32165 [bacterium]|nr:hypothetical protein [bacterium]